MAVEQDCWGRGRGLTVRCDNCDEVYCTKKEDLHEALDVVGDAGWVFNVARGYLCPKCQKPKNSVESREHGAFRGDEQTTTKERTEKVSDVSETLKERGSRYGVFKDHAGITQSLKEVMQKTPAWGTRLQANHKEALEMIAHKIARILNGDPNYADSWHDIAGYAKLIEDEINGKPQ